MNATVESNVLELQETEVSRDMPLTHVQQHQLTATQRTDSQVFFKVITEAASNPLVDIEKMERLWAMHERLVARDSEHVFNASMTAAQALMGRISADAENTQTRSKYATYGQLDRHVRPIYTAHGFSLSFDTADGAPEGCERILAYVAHSGGHSRTYRADIPSDGKGAKGGDVMTKTHASGSAKSYGMRYLLKMIFNLAIGEDDDDGNAASAHQVVAANKVLGGLLADIKAAKSDEAVCQIWDTGSRALAAVATEAEITDLSNAVAKRRADFMYPADRFEASLASWVEVVTSGRKSEADLLTFIQSKHPLSIEQKDKIHKAILAAKK